MKNEVWGYARVSTKEQNLARHEDIVSSSIDEGRHRNHLSKDEKVSFDWCWKLNTGNKKRQAINLRVMEE